MKPTDSKIRDVVEIAQTAFWQSVAEQLPQIKTGDLAPLDQVVFDLNCERVIRTWIDTNSEECS